MTAAPKHLTLAPETPPVGPQGYGPDIYAAIAEKRRSIDWARVHIQGGRNAPLDLKDRPRSKGWTR